MQSILGHGVPLFAQQRLNALWGQDEAEEVFTVTVYSHYKFTSEDVRGVYNSVKLQHHQALKDLASFGKENMTNKWSHVLFFGKYDVLPM